jgi:hypothetical protein
MDHRRRSAAVNRVHTVYRELGIADAVLLAFRAGLAEQGGLVRSRFVFEPSTRVRWAAWLAEIAREHVAFMRGTYGIAGAEEKLLLRGAGESMRLSMDYYECWAINYERGSASHVVHAADDEPRGQGATAVMKFFAAGGLEFHVFPPL